MNNTSSQKIVLKFNIIGLGYGKMEGPSRLTRHKVPLNINHCEYGNIRRKLRIPMVRSILDMIHMFMKKQIRPTCFLVLQTHFTPYGKWSLIHYNIKGIFIIIFQTINAFKSVLSMSIPVLTIKKLLNNPYSFHVKM